MARPKAKTGPVAAPWSVIAGSAETVELSAEVREIVGAAATDPFLQRIADAVAECQFAHHRDDSAPTTGESAATLRAIFQHAEHLVGLLGGRTDELAEPLRGLSAAVGRDWLEQLRQALRLLSEESVVALRPYLAPTKGRKPGIAEPHQVLLGIRCWEALESVSIRPTLTASVDDGKPASVYLKLLAWALRVSRLGGDARKIGSAAKRVRQGLQKVHARD